MQALIDGDILVYRSAFGAQKNVNGIVEADPIENALHGAKKGIGKILGALNTSDYKLYLTSDDKSNYRFSLAKQQEYKGNRKKMIKPVHYQAVRDYLMDRWNGIMCYGQEADDALGIEQCKNNLTKGKTCICSIDKDMDMIPGFHYNWVKDEQYEICNTTGIRNFYKQLLVGDRADNIPGIKGIGDVKANKLLGHLNKEIDMFNMVKDIYSDNERLLEIGRLLWIRRKENQMWTFPGTEQIN